MNREFEEWADSKIREHSPDGSITRDTVLKVARDAIVDVSRAEETIRAREDVDTAEHIIQQTLATRLYLLEAIGSCCGDDAGRRFCESHGCGVLKRILLQLQSALTKSETE